MKADAVSHLNHQLRTPILAMQETLSILLDGLAGPLTDEQRRFIELSQRNLTRVNRLLNDLLDLLKLETRESPLQPGPGSLAVVVESVCTSLAPLAAAKPVTIVKTIPQGVPATAFDQRRITQALTNLLSQAIAWTPEGGRIIIEVRPAAGGLEVRIASYPAAGARVDASASERAAAEVSGSGLELAISQQIVELHQGQMAMEIGSGDGADVVFTVTLPLHTP